VVEPLDGDDVPLLDGLPLNYDETTIRTIEQIDVLWLRGRAIRPRLSSFPPGKVRPSKSRCAPGVPTLHERGHGAVQPATPASLDARLTRIDGRLTSRD
jgi:hypothetical protein